MKNLCAEFSIKLRTAMIVPPDAVHDDWGKFAKDPEHKYLGVLSLNDGCGSVELVVMDWGWFGMNVCAVVSDEVIDALDSSNLEHQRTIQRFWIRALTVLNNFISRYRIRTFDYRNHPINWMPTHMRQQDGKVIRLAISIETPIEVSVKWLVDGSYSDKPEKSGLEILVNKKMGRSSRPYHDSYSPTTIDAVCDDVRQLSRGADPSQSLYYETALELIMHAQEIVTREEKESIEERPAVVCAALVTAASACEVFVRGLVETHGSDLHKYIIAKRKNFQIVELVDQVFADIPAIDCKLSLENAELAHNIGLLFQARNRSAHRGRPEIHVMERDCRIRGWMLYDETLDDHEFGFFTWDVLALIAWSRSRLGEAITKPALQSYWDQQKGLSKRTRERQIYDLDVGGRDWPK